MRGWWIPILVAGMACDMGEVAWTCNTTEGIAWSEGTMSCLTDCNSGADLLAEEQAACEADASDGVCICSRAYEDTCNQWRADKDCAG